MKFLGIVDESLSFIVGALVIGAVLGAVYLVATYEWAQTVFFASIGIPLLWFIGRAIRAVYRLHQAERADMRRFKGR